MNIFKKYSAYLKDNPKGYWFKRKLYGWGWFPAKWQGWFVILSFLVFAFWNALQVGPLPTDNDIYWFLIKFIWAIILLFLICLQKGEEPNWQWGSKK